MALLELKYRSASLGQDVSVNIVVPENKEGTFKTLWLLHGLHGDQDSWMRYTSVERYAKLYELAVVMPCADCSWYTDTAYGKKYFTFITEELPSKMAHFFKGYSSAREDNLVMGLSMGGYGAVKAALTCPEKYSFCAAFSGSLDITRKNRPCNLEEWRSIFGFDLKSPVELEGTKHDLFTIAKEANDPPFIYMWCGTEDPLIEANEQFSRLLSGLGVEHTFHYSEGTHSWKYWDAQLQKALACWKEYTEENC